MMFMMPTLQKGADGFRRLDDLFGAFDLDVELVKLNALSLETA